MARKYTRQDLRDAAEKYKNWASGARTTRSARSISPPPRTSSQRPASSRREGDLARAQLRSHRAAGREKQISGDGPHQSNPHHAAHGTDAYSGVLDKRGIRAADDMVVMPLQCGTQWDGLGHVFYENYMWNGYDCREVTTAGAQKCGIEKTKHKMVGRGVFLDVARFKGVDSLDDGYGITCQDLDETAKKQGVTMKRGDYVIVRTGQMERCQKLGSWDGYPGGDAPASPSRPWSGSSAPSSRRWRATPGAARCGRTRAKRASTSPGTGSPSRSWA